MVGVTIEPGPWRWKLSLNERIPNRTIRSYFLAARPRLDEGVYLNAGGFGLAAIYHWGYAAECAIGASLTRLLNTSHGVDQPIPDKETREIVNSSRHLSKMIDKSHPIDGLALLLIEARENARTERSAMPTTQEIEDDQRIKEYSEVIARNWGPTLRYHTVLPTAEEIQIVKSAAEWLVGNLLLD